MGKVMKGNSTKTVWSLYTRLRDVLIYLNLRVASLRTFYDTNGRFRDRKHYVTLMYKICLIVTTP